MSGIDFVDTIVVRSTGKGTGLIRESLKTMNWAGKGFKESQEKKLDGIKGLKIESAKGTAKIDLSQMYRTTVPNVEGHYISYNRGTELLKL